MYRKACRCSYAPIITFLLICLLPQTDHRSLHETNNIETRHLNQLEPVKQNVPPPNLNPVELPPAVNNVEETASTTKNHGLIGLALTMGFVLMFLVDHLGNEAFARPLFSVFHCFCCQRRTNDLLLPSAAALAAAEHSASTTTMGLVVHSLADGLAIGAAFGLTLDLTLILFAPAAFGFVSFLVHEGLPRNRVKVYLLIFALASPVGALLTYLVVSANAYVADQQAGFFLPSTWFFNYFLLNFNFIDELAHDTIDLTLSLKALSMGVASTSSTGTGFALLLSGGTFLYVATAHILPHLHTEKPISSSPLNGNTHHRHQSITTFKPIESIAFVFGSCVPVLISFGHSH
ncbi:unnamed protein product [Hydatigera taeniaeformis]|uniref:Zinc transporter ZIP9 n=1 Tax=Hydatigena taeniaeformis TaxID=6205 RepID=A0A0R3X9W3_HYDTA|nr:unnamed protein product [Hydatigera taeniaeformis]